MRMRVAGVAVLALVALACGSGSSTKPSGEGKKSAAPAQVSTVPVGQSLTLSKSLLGKDSEAVVTVKSANVHTDGPDQYTKPKGEFVVADVAIDCTGGSYYVSTSNFAIVAADGTRTEATYTSFDPMLSSTTLQAGQKAAGNVVFDVPAGTAAGSKIAIRDVLGSKDLGYWQL